MKYFLLIIGIILSFIINMVAFYYAWINDLPNTMNACYKIISNILFCIGCSLFITCCYIFSRLIQLNRKNKND